MDGSLVIEFSDPIAQFIQRIALSPDNRYLVTSGQAVGLWDYQSGELLKLIPNAGRISDNPFSSDDGFSVINYRRVNPDFGTWEDRNR